MKELNEITITDISAIIRVVSVKGREEMMINRKCYGISFCINGEIVYRHNGCEIISDCNHAIILPKGGTYEICGTKTGVFPVINFDCPDELCDTVTAIPINNNESFIHSFEQMENLYLFTQNRAKIMSVLYDMFHRISQTAPNRCGILAPAIKFIETSYSDPSITNKTLADLCNISEIYFRRQFKTKFGITPKQYILNVRLQRAKQLLLDGRYKINTISEECGFASQYHFSRIFREKIGKSATEFIKENRTYKI